MSIIAAGTTTTTALSSTGNTDGTLQFQVNGTTPSVTLNTLGAIGVGASPAFGTSGQVLTSAGSTAAPTWATVTSSQWTTSGSNIFYNTGNVGIRTTTFSSITANAATLSLGGTSTSTSGGIAYQVNGTLKALHYVDADLLYHQGVAGVGQVFWTNNTERMRLDSSGNLGLGVTPGAWTLYRAFDIGGNQSVATYQDGATNTIGFVANALWSGSWVYRQSSVGASRYALINNSHAWFTAPSGTAGNAISFTQAMTLDANGKLTIGASASSADRLLINGPVQFGQAGDTNAYISFLGGNNYLSGSGTIRMNVGSGGVQLTSGATSWASASDERLKDIIEPITGAMAKVNTLRTVMGKYKTDAEGTRRPFLIAQDVVAVLPEAVDSVADTREGDETEYLSVRYTDTIPLLIAAIKELKVIVDAQAVEIAALKGQA